MAAVEAGRMVARQMATRRSSWRGRLAVRLLEVLGAVLRRLPDRQLHRGAHALGGVLYRAQGERRELVRSNLSRVCRALVAGGLASPAVSRAAADDRALERLVRDAFGHYVRGYLEAMIVPRYAGSRGRKRVTADEPALVDELLGREGSAEHPAIVIGLHFGAMEVPGIVAAGRGARIASPMETIADPDLQAYLLRTRSATGLRIIPTEGAGRVLSAWLAAGRPVAIVADRVVRGAGTRVELFGAPARLPVGPAVLAIESGAACYVAAARRTGWGEYRVRVERLAIPAVGTRRERLAAFLAAQAATFERVIADAPEQWWTLFFPIWEAKAEADARRSGS